MFWRVHQDAGLKVMSNVRLAFDWAGRKFSFFCQFFVCCVGRKGLNSTFLGVLGDFLWYDR